MDIIDFYKGIIESLSLSIDEDDTVVFDTIDDGEVYYINNKALVIPTPTVLANPDWDNNIAFHPLCENIARKDSIVLKQIQHLADLTVNSYIGEIMTTIIDICADNDKQVKLNHKQNAILSCYPNSDTVALKNMMKIEKAFGGYDNKYVRIVTLRDKKIGKVHYPRVTFITFPFYEELKKLVDEHPKEYHVFGVKIRKKDAIGYKAIFEYLFKHLDKGDEHYTVGTRGNVAPSFQSFMTGFYKVMKELKRTFKLLKVDFPDISWGEQLEELSQYKGLIPVLQGNDGEITEGDRRRDQMQNVQQPVVQTAQVVKPVQSVQPVQHKEEPVDNNKPKVLTFNNRFKSAVQPTSAQPLHQVIPQPHQNEVLPTPQPVQPQMPQPVAPPVQQPYVQQPYQQPQGYQPPVDAYGRPLPQQQMYPQQMGYGQPVQQPMQRPVDPYGRPIPTDAYGRPMQQGMYPQQQMGYGQQQGQPMYDQFGRPIQAPQGMYPYNYRR